MLAAVHVYTTYIDCIPVYQLLPWDFSTDINIISAFADNVAADLIMPTSDPNFPTDLGVDVKPCGYPLLNGKLT